MAQFARKLVWEDVDSSNVQAVAFDKETETIAVKFKQGGLYSYIKANTKLPLTPGEVFSELSHAISVGGYLNQVVKANFAYTRWADEEELLANLNLS